MRAENNHGRAGAAGERAGQRTLFVVGDSISMHYGPYLEQYCARRFHYGRKTGEEEFLTSEENRVANGGDSARVQAYLEALEASEWPRFDVILVNCGLHDIRVPASGGPNQVPLEAYTETVREIVRLARVVASRFVWIRSTPVVDDIHNSPRMEFHRHAADLAAYNEAADRIMASAGVPVIDLHGFTSALGPPEEIFADHVHYVEPIRKLQAAYIAGGLDREADGGEAG